MDEKKQWLMQEDENYLSYNSYHQKKASLLTATAYAKTTLKN